MDLDGAQHTEISEGQNYCHSDKYEEFLGLDLAIEATPLRIQVLLMMTLMPDSHEIAEEVYDHSKRGNFLADEVLRRYSNKEWFK